MASENLTTLTPAFGRSTKAPELFRAFADQLRRCIDEELERGVGWRVDSTVQETLRNAQQLRPSARQVLTAATHLLTDLARQGWRVETKDSDVCIAPPVAILRDPVAEKDRVRRQLQVERTAQLREPAVREFIRSMEAKHFRSGRFVSIFSLMRDGRELAEALGRAREQPKDTETSLAAAIKPYLQFVDGDATCEHTGLRLVDIWRYFRHTWATVYRSVPGRTMMVLVRDAAGLNHPVIGIAALSSAAVQISVRDDWIGWSPAVAVAQMRSRPSVRYGRWAQEVVKEALAETYVDDLLVDNVLKPWELRRPTDLTLERLRQEETEQRQRHNRFARSRDHKENLAPAEMTDEHWLEQARSHLFRSKRAGLLARLLLARSVLQHFLGKRPTKDDLHRLLEDPAGRRALAMIVRKAKADRVGVAVADISVCGAIQPYSAVLGGKLTAMLLTGPETVEAYHHRYRDVCSVIASSMAGRRIVRPSHLVLLGTTSLYGVGSSQYNRIRIPCSEVGGETGETVAYHELGATEGYGTFHISRASAAALTRLLERNADGRRVHNIFGEGVNPRLRHIREGLAAVGFPADFLLKHGSQRLVYAVPLARNFREYLLGLAKRPDYHLPCKNTAHTTNRIASWWSRRWLAGRVHNQNVLDAVASQTLVHPIRHGARVELPPEDPNQGLLFEESRPVR